MYNSKIVWEWGLEEIKSFKSKKEREDFLDRNDAVIAYSTDWSPNNRMDKILSMSEGKSDYDPTRNMTDYEMDVLL